MPTWDVVCLANSAKHGGRCVAGLRLDGGGWVRPVSTEAEGVLQPWHYTLTTGGEAALLDVLSMRLLGPRPDPHHPENWRMGHGLWDLVARPLPPEARAVLYDALTLGPALLGDTGDRIEYRCLESIPAKASLALVRPDDLAWQVRDSVHSGRRQTRAIFALGGARYNLSLTDPLWLNRLGGLPLGLHPYEGRAVLLTVSLSEPFARDGFCYKLVAGVICLI